MVYGLLQSLVEEYCKFCENISRTPQIAFYSALWLIVLVNNRELQVRPV